MDQQIIARLEQLHLSENEAKVYLALLKTGQTSAGAIIKKTNFHRSVVYETLQKLIDRKLVFKLERNKIAYFQITETKRILENALAEHEIAKDLVPVLTKITKERPSEITIYEGVKSYRQFWMNMVRNLPEGSIDYIAGSIGEKWQEYMGPDFYRYLRTRIKRKIIWKLIIFEKELLDLEIFTKYPKYYECRYINKKFSKTGNFNIFNDDSLILHLATEPLIIEVKNKGLAMAFRNLFDILWDIGKPL